MIFFFNFFKENKMTSLSIENKKIIVQMIFNSDFHRLEKVSEINNGMRYLIVDMILDLIENKKLPIRGHIDYIRDNLHKYQNHQLLDIDRRLKRLIRGQRFLKSNHKVKQMNR